MSCPLRGALLASSLLAAGACGRTDYDARADGAPVASGNLVPDEAIAVAEGFTIEVYRDLSDDILYDAVDFADGAETSSNRPDDLTQLFAPLGPGLGVVAGRSVYEVPSDGGAVVEHSYRPPVANDTGPDHLVDCVRANLGTESLLCGATSLTDGDGVYRIDDAWGITRLYTDNNVFSVFFDEQGQFDDRGVATDYYAHESAVLRVDDQGLVRTGTYGSLAVLPSGDLLAVDEIASGIYSIVTLSSQDHTRTFLASAGKLVLAEGAPPGSPAELAYAVHEGRSIVVLGEDGVLRPLATTSDDWDWTSVVSPIKGHPLEGGLYLLEVQTNSNRERILRLAPTP